MVSNCIGGGILGGRGAYSATAKMRAKALSMDPTKMTDEQIRDAMGSIDSDIKKRVDEMHRIEWDGMVGGSPEHQEWLRLLGQNQQLQERRRALQFELDERWRRDNRPSQSARVNGFGEATSRYITSQIYENAMRRNSKAVLRNMGY